MVEAILTVAAISYFFIGLSVSIYKCVEEGTVLTTGIGHGFLWLLMVLRGIGRAWREIWQ